jgi:hypothetical protein
LTASEREELARVAGAPSERADRVTGAKVLLAVAAGRPERVDYEYELNGTTNLFLACQPRAGWRHVDRTERRTKHDFAHQTREQVDCHFPDATTIRVVLDNLNTHTPAALYEAFAPAEARRVLRKLEFHYTPVHGSWLRHARAGVLTADLPLAGPPNRRPGHVGGPGRRVGGRPQRATRDHLLAVHRRRRPVESPSVLPFMITVVQH